MTRDFTDESEKDVEYATGAKDVEDEHYGWACAITSQEISYAYGPGPGKDMPPSVEELPAREEEDLLLTMNLNDSKYHILNWLAILADNRTYWQNGSIAEEAKKYIKEHFLIDITPYDIIVGYRADDSYFSFAQDFVSGVISLEKLSEAMWLGKLGEQIVLKSPKAFETIYFQNYENVDAEIYYIKRAEREREARREYRRRKKESADIHELFMLDIMREGMENGDTRLFR